MTIADSTSPFARICSVCISGMSQLIWRTARLHGEPCSHCTNAIMGALDPPLSHLAWPARASLVLCGTRLDDARMRGEGQRACVLLFSGALRPAANATSRTHP